MRRSIPGLTYLILADVDVTAGEQRGGKLFCVASRLAVEGGLLPVCPAIEAVLWFSAEHVRRQHRELSAKWARRARRIWICRDTSGTEERERAPVLDPVSYRFLADTEGVGLTRRPYENQYLRIPVFLLDLGVSVVPERLPREEIAHILMFNAPHALVPELGSSMRDEA